MAYNPRTYNLFQNIDISVSLEKAKIHFDNVRSGSDRDPHLSFRVSRIRF